MMGATLETSESPWQPGSTLRRLVIVADDSLVVQAIHIAFRRSGDFKLVGYATAQRPLLERSWGPIRRDPPRRHEALGSSAPARSRNPGSG